MGWGYSLELDANRNDRRRGGVNDGATRALSRGVSRARVNSPVPFDDIAESLGGGLSYEPAESGGSRFKLRLPVV